MQNETVITVQGYGTFIIPTDRVTQLISWLQSNKAIGVNENNVQGGDQLLRG